MTRKPWLRLAPFLLATACGTTEPTPSPSPTVSPTPTPTPTPVACTGTPRTYGQAVSDWWVPRCSLAQNIYNDPQTSLGPPDATGFGPNNYTGFISLGFGGRVTVDLGGCIQDKPGPDIRVFQAVSGEPVSLYVSTGPEGPFTLVEDRQPCGNRINAILGYCDFDLAEAGVKEARYLRVEDGELFPCPGGTKSEGADLDAVQALGVTTMAGGLLPR